MKLHNSFQRIIRTQCLLYAGGLSLILTVGGVSSQDRKSEVPPRIRFEAASATLADAAKMISARTERKTRVELEKGHPANRRVCTIGATFDDSTDMLNCVSSAFGVRWMEDPRSGDFLLLSKEAYRSRVSGLRQATADGIDVRDRKVLLFGSADGNREVENILKKLESTEGDRLMLATKVQAVPLDALDPALAQPLRGYLRAYAAFKLGAACDQYYRDLQSMGQAEFHYGPNPRGTKQFSFRVGTRWIVVKPE